MTRSVMVVSLLLLVTGSVAAAETKTSATFELVIPSLLEAKFHGCDGLASESEIIEFRDGGTGETRKVPGRLKYEDIVLKRGVSSDHSLATWRALVEAGEISAARRNGTIVVYDKTGRAVARYHLFEAWPSRVSVDLDVETGIAVESIVITVERIERE